MPPGFPAGVARVTRAAAAVKQLDTWRLPRGAAGSWRPGTGRGVL